MQRYSQVRDRRKAVCFRENALVSGGCVYFDDDWKDYVSSGPWDIELDNYKELEPYKAEILKVVNKNVKFGCCGGCV